MSDIKVQRLHHNAFVVKDHEVTRHFYEDILDLPLIASWAEKAELQGNVRECMHTFYELADGNALAFFAMAHEEDYEDLGPQFRPSLLIHLAMRVDEATQKEIRARVEACGTPVIEMDHGYVKSIYITDPDGLLIEFTVEPPNYPEISALKRKTAHEDLKNWMAGDLTPNNDVRTH